MSGSEPSGLDPLLEDFLYWQHYGSVVHLKRMFRSHWKGALVAGFCSALLAWIIG